MAKRDLTREEIQRRAERIVLLAEAAQQRADAVNKMKRDWADLKRHWVEFAESLRLFGRETRFRLVHPYRAIRTWIKHGASSRHDNLHLLYQQDQQAKADHWEKP